MKTLNNFFNHIYCINLLHRTDRWEEMSKEFLKHFLTVERFEAINGKDIFQPGLNRHAGAYGNLLTNIKIFEDAILKKYKSILIFEDDVHLNDNINERFWKKIEYLPDDWNLLYLGGNNQFDWGSFEMITGDKTIKITKQNYNTFDCELVKTKWTQCAYALAYNNNIFVDFLERLKVWKEPADILQPLLQSHNIYKAYVFLPTLVKPKAGYSDVGGGYVDYNQGLVNNF
jgi:GR25 family glycosyltransferase involved in LPS biosynthesis